jgi:hypothetical protein
MSVALLVLALLLALPADAAAGWRAPVAAPVSRVFDVGANPYEGGRHRGIDLAARPATTVRAPCAGRVVVAGRIGVSGGVVTVLCGRWRVSELPLATVTVRAGGTVTAGTALGTLATSHAHAGLHLGVRRDGTRFGYVDPLRFFAARRVAPPTLGRAPRSRPRPTPPDTPVAAPATSPVSPPIKSPAPAMARSPVIAAPPAARGDTPLAPWPAWVGLALVLAGAAVGWRRSARTRIQTRLRAAVRSSG